MRALIVALLAGFIMLHRIDGSPVWFRVDQIQSVQQPARGESTKDAHSAIVTSNSMTFVAETPEQVMGVLGP